MSLHALLIGEADQELGRDDRLVVKRQRGEKMREHRYCVYMVASKSRVLYIGMTNNLHRRIFEHKNDRIEGFSSQYRCHRLVYYESFDDVRMAINREKQLKCWNRGKKVWLIERVNPTWEDLAVNWYKRHRYQPEKQQVPLLAS